MEKQGTFEKIHKVASKIPAGTVATYGQLARLCGMQNGARIAGWAMMAEHKAVPVPAHRVVHADGRLCEGSEWEAVQRQMLLEEGIAFTDKGRVDMKRCQVDDGELALLMGEVAL